MIHPNLSTFRVAIANMQNAKDAMSSVHGVMEEYHKGHSGSIPVNVMECLDNLQRNINKLKELELFFSNV